MKEKAVGVLVCTVGTSFNSNIKNCKPQENPKYGETQEIFKNLQMNAGNENESHFLKKLTTNLLDYPPSNERLLGAEINSISSMHDKGFLSKDPLRVIFFVSDTDEGRLIGKILTDYFKHQKAPIKFADCEYVVIEGLQDKAPERFKKDGLTNLVREMGKYFDRWQYSGFGINATGGYKAQIAMAVAFGQVMQIPVFYKHEFFDQIISFPRAPFTINLDLVDRNLKFWADAAEPSAQFDEETLKSYNLPEDEWEQISTLFEEILVNGKAYYAITPLGLIYWQKYCSSNKDKVIPLADVPNLRRRGCHYPEHHYPDGFRDYVEKLYKENLFVISCHSLPYSKQKSIAHGDYYQHENQKIVGEYCDKNGFGARFEVVTDASNALERKWVISQLKNWHKSNG